MRTDREIRTAIVEANLAFMEAFEERDAAAVARLYAEAAQLLPPNADIVAGSDAIEAFWRNAMESGLSGVRLETVEVDAFGDTAVEAGRYTLLSDAGAEQRPADNGKYLVVWKRQNTAWRLYRDIWNSSRPLSAA
jgi:uncharacterized protein (TIGR02246 family)